MKRVLIALSGFALAGIFALIMYVIHGDLNWGSANAQRLSWFEPVFRLLVLSGSVFLIVSDTVSWLKRR